MTTEERLALLEAKVEKLERQLFVYETYTQYVNACSNDTNYDYVERYVKERDKDDY